MGPLADSIYNSKLELGFWLDSQKGEKNSSLVTIGDKLSSLFCCCRARGGNQHWGVVKGSHGTQNRGWSSTVKPVWIIGATTGLRWRLARLRQWSRVTPGYRAGIAGLRLLGLIRLRRIYALERMWAGREGKKDGWSRSVGDSGQERFMKNIKFNLFPGLNHIHTQFKYELILLEP
jgi:hypothetical protein